MQIIETINNKGVIQNPSVIKYPTKHVGIKLIIIPLTKIKSFLYVESFFIRYKYSPFIKSKITAKGENAAEIISYILTATLFFLCILILASDTYSPFIYFRF
jgi:hypothetical protein